jgi:uncharacterized protein
MDGFVKIVQQVKLLQASQDPSHDYLHVLRVRRTCERIGSFLKARMEVLIPAALLHDIVHVPKNHPDRERASELAAAEARRILVEAEVPAEQVTAILQVIREHSYSSGRSPTSLESAILQDADRLDAIGAIGIARVFSCGTLMGSSFYSEEEPFAVQRPLQDKKFMLDHFYAKLLLLADRLNTEPAREEARKRMELMKLFIHQLREELG